MRGIIHTKMLAALLLLASSAALAAPASHPLRAADVARALTAAVPAGATARAGADLNCSTCETVMQVYVDIAGNATTLKQFIALFDEACDVIAPGTPVGALCELLINTTIEDLVPFLYDQLHTLAWDIPETFCAVFIPVCTVDCCDAPTAPEQLRLAFTNDAAAWSVQWTTLALVGDAGVQWGEAGASGQPSSAAAVPRTYGLGGWRGTLYSATMGGLAPGTTYTYRVGSASGGWSEAANFTTLPANAGTPARPLRLLHIGDMGWGDNSNNTIAAMGALVANGSVDALLHTGDVSYADGQQKSWDVYGRKIEAISRSIPYMVGVGNHEQVWWGGAPYRARWTMPAALNPLTRQPLPAATTANRSFYALDIGAPKALHFAMYDTESVLDVSDVSAANVAWLKQDLALAAAGGATWVITGGHRPLYCTNGGFNGGNKDCKGMSETLRTQVEATFAGVDLVLGSHMHGYERTRPIKAGVPLPGNGTNAVGAPVYIVNGAGGNREGNEDPKGDAPWSVPGAHSGAFGYGLITLAAGGAPGASSLQYKFVESATGAVLDELTLTK